MSDDSKKAEENRKKMEQKRKEIEAERKKQKGDGINKTIIEKGRKINGDKLKKKK